MNSARDRLEHPEPRESIATVFWADGRIWIVCGPPGLRRRWCLPLLDCYEPLSTLAPAPEIVERILGNLGASIADNERFEFDVQATILRAVAREFHA